MWLFFGWKKVTVNYTLDPQYKLQIVSLSANAVEKRMRFLRNGKCEPACACSATGEVSGRFQIQIGG